MAVGRGVALGDCAAVGRGVGLAFGVRAAVTVAAGLAAGRFCAARQAVNPARQPKTNSSQKRFVMVFLHGFPLLLKMI